MAGGSTAEDEAGRSPEADVVAREATPVGASPETPTVVSAAAELRDHRSGPSEARKDDILFPAFR
jgi:hypothetical protein